MADNVGYTPGTGATVAADEIAGVLHQRVKIGIGTDGSATDVSSSNPMPVTGTVTANTGLTQPLTDVQLRALAVPVSGTFFQATQPVSAASLPLPSGASTSALQTTGNTSLSNIDGKLPALVSSRVPVDGSGVTQPVSGTFWQATQPVSGTVTANTGLSQPLTDAQLRATAIQIQGTVSGTAVPVSGTFFQATQPVSIAASVAVTGPLTDAQLRAADVPVSGPLTDTQLRASNVPVVDAQSGNLLLRILQMLMAPLGYDKSLGRQRGTVVLESGTVTAVTTVTTLSNVGAIGGYSAQMQVFDTNRTSWAQCVRSRIS